MSNYQNIETDFIERTLELISQYDSMLYKYEFEKQFNHTLLINCLLGIIVFPKERAISFLPNEKITKELLKNMGVEHSSFNTDITELKSLIIALRHSIAHFDIHFVSENDEFLINEIQFKDRDKGVNYVIATFIPSELLNFIRYYGSWFVSSIRKHKS
jgi:hypothetical protein